MKGKEKDNNRLIQCVCVCVKPSQAPPKRKPTDIFLLFFFPCFYFNLKIYEEEKERRKRDR